MVLEWLSLFHRFRSTLPRLILAGIFSSCSSTLLFLFTPDCLLLFSRSEAEDMTVLAVSQFVAQHIPCIQKVLFKHDRNFT